jgi:choline-sulfatase
MSAPARDTRRDLVLILTDQHRYDQVGFASDGHFETPNLDALAARGVVFESAYSTSTVCVPARVSLLTGLQPHRVPTQENRFALREGFWTLARELAAAGYETAAIGKMHFSPVHADHGFETLRLCEHLSAQGLGPLAVERGDVVDDYHDWLVDQGLADHRSAVAAPVSGAFPNVAPAHPTSWVERETISFLEARDRSRPLFLVISFPNPHAPYDPPEPYASMFDPADSILPTVGQEANRRMPKVFGWATRQSSTRAEAENPRAVRVFLALVRGLVRQIDDSLGRILSHVDLGSASVVFTSDHGDFSGHRGLMRKSPWIPFDDLARVPFVVAGAGVTAGRRVAEVVQSSDVVPTFLDHAGLDPPDGLDLDSRSLRPLIERGPTAEDRERAVFSAISMGWPMVRQGRYKLIGHEERPGRVLFDLEADPHERTNLALDPDHLALRDHLTGLLEAMKAKPRVDVVERGTGGP